mgnify:CR=1 FL=1
MFFGFLYFMGKRPTSIIPVERTVQEERKYRVA